jgi:hypothetical protein
MKFNAIWAYYGSTPVKGEASKCADVTKTLNDLLANSPNNNAEILINSSILGVDPYPAHLKAFCAKVSVDGVEKTFTAVEDQTVDFAK